MSRCHSCGRLVQDPPDIRSGIMREQCQVCGRLYFPSGAAERDLLRTQLAQAQADLARVEGERDELRKELGGYSVHEWAVLEKERDQLQKLLAKALEYPIDKVMRRGMYRSLLAAVHGQEHADKWFFGTE